MEAVPVAHRKGREVKEDARDLLPGELCNAGELECLVEQAPEEVRQVLNILLGAPQELMELLVRSWKHRGKRNECGNNFLCALTGQDPSQIDLERALKDHFSGDNIDIGNERDHHRDSAPLAVLQG